MPLQKQNVAINFGQGLDTKTDPWQVQSGKMLTLQNAIFTKGGLLQKRNGYMRLPSVDDAETDTLATFQGNLLSIGNGFKLLSQDSAQWLDRGVIQHVDLSVIPAVRASTGQTTVDTVTASNGLACAVWLDTDTNTYYQIVDSETGQVIVATTALPSGAKMPRVFMLGNYFIITFLVTTNLKYIAIPVVNPMSPGSAATLSTHASGATAGYDGVVATNGSLYIGFDADDMGGAVRFTSLSSGLSQGSTITIAGKTSNLMTATCDTVTGTLWFTFWNSGDSNGWVVAFNPSLIQILSATKIIDTLAVTHLTATAVNGLYTLFYQLTNTYPSTVRSDIVYYRTSTLAGTLGTITIMSRSVGLASKAFYVADTGKSYMLCAYQSTFQPTYFLIDNTGNVVAKLAYGNGGGYPIDQILPSAVLSGNQVSIGYLFKDLVVPINKTPNQATTSSFLYSQTGINIATFEINNTATVPSEIGNNLHLTGGFLWMYDGVKPVEHNFHLFPEDMTLATATGSGLITAGDYYYYAVYRWTDAQGNIHRSAPSLPVSQTTTTATSTNTLVVPTLRLTYKTAPNGVVIEIYRGSTAQPIAYLLKTYSTCTANNPAVDYVTITDAQADTAISGNLILYTTGGVVENIGAPACSTATLYKQRLVLVDAEDRNTLWYSKQVIQATPVEMSDLFTIYVAPTISAQGPTGPITALGAMDDKLIIFKKDAIYYITGNGPDITGASNDFSEPVFITSTVGCDNQQSVVFMPNGLMFQSDKGIWLLGRDLTTSYIGAVVEQYNVNTVESSLTVPGTNQVRFTLDSGVTLMFDYFYNQWGTFNGIPAISSTIYQGLHTFLDSYGRIYQENPGSYLDGANPVLIKFTTSWINAAGLQGFERAYYFTMLGQYLSPHKLSVAIGYDYVDAPTQVTSISPSNFNLAYGEDQLYGSTSPYGGNSSVEQFRIFLQKQKCQAFQITLSESYDGSFGDPAGAGLTLSGFNMVIGLKKGYTSLAASQSVG